jgi:hypothetical protein
MASLRTVFFVGEYEVTLGEGKEFELILKPNHPFRPTRIATNSFLENSFFLECEGRWPRVDAAILSQRANLRRDSRYISPDIESGFPLDQPVIMKDQEVRVKCQYTGYVPSPYCPGCPFCFQVLLVGVAE